MQNEVTLSKSGCESNERHNLATLVQVSALSLLQIAGDQPSAEAEGCVRLRDHLFAERVQHLHRLPALPVHLRRDRRAALQREVLLLHRREQARCSRVPVSRQQPQHNRQDNFF